MRYMEITLETIGRLVLAAIIIVVIVVIPVTLYGAIFGNKDEKTARQQFKSIIVQMNQLRDGDTETTAKQISADFVIVGFNVDTQQVNGIFKPPNECIQTCICICKKDDSRCSNGYCEKLGQYNAIYGEGNNPLYIQNDGKPMQIKMVRNEKIIHLYVDNNPKK
ncbi:MAG: hypothetical protein QXK37_02265 [Candidatus Woesearchaeota archaeon]